MKTTTRKTSPAMAGLLKTGGKSSKARFVSGAGQVFVPSRNSFAGLQNKMESHMKPKTGPHCPAATSVKGSSRCIHFPCRQAAS